jgi:hypothetical protein
MHPVSVACINFCQYVWMDGIQAACLSLSMQVKVVIDMISNGCVSGKLYLALNFSGMNSEMESVKP